MAREGKPRGQGFALSGKQLKIFGCLAMLCYTAAASMLRNGVLHANLYGSAELLARIEADPNLTVAAGWASVLQLIGSLSVPVFAFLLAEGFLHTSSLKRYLLSILACAAVSEVPYDLAMYGRPWSLEGQNAMFTCAVCLLMLYGLRELAGRKGLLLRLMQLVILLAALLWTRLLRCAFGPVTVLLCAIYYLLRGRKLERILLGCVASAAYITAPLTGIALWFYSGDRGAIRNKYLFYAFYPIHLLVFGILACVLARMA